MVKIAAPLPYLKKQKDISIGHKHCMKNEFEAGEGKKKEQGTGITYSG